MEAMQLKSESSRANAMLSTGPKTAAGKAISSRNAETHGLTAKRTLLRDEDPEAYAQLLAEYMEEYEPATSSQRDLVKRAVHWQWKLYRAERVEAGFFDKEVADATFAPDAAPGSFAPDAAPGSVGPDAAPESATRLADAICARTKEFSVILRYANSFARSLERALKELKAMQEDRLEAMRLMNAAHRQEVQNLLEKAALDRRELEFKLELAKRGMLVEQSAGAAVAAAATDGSGLTAKDKAMGQAPAGGGKSSQELDQVDWLDVVQSLYNAVSAGPQSPHPLPENYHGAYAIWLKQQLMVEQDIGDDEAGSQLVAAMVALKMRLANVLPKPGTVWGSPEEITAWREAVKTKNPYPKWCELVRREYGRRGRKARMKQEA